jgi:Cu/Ag efflux protein CusF
MIRSLVLALAVVLSLGNAACGSGEPADRGTGSGTVSAVDAAKGEITLDHGPIEGLMGAMTMTFPVRDPQLLAGVVPGAKVEFDVVHEDGSYVVTAIRPR